LNLNHILLFLAMVSSLLVLGRAWRPGAVAAATWRIAALIVLASTGVAWLFWRDAAGYVGGCAWFLLLFLPAIGLRKMTELATQGNFKSARKLGASLQILHPSPELRDQIRLFRRLESQANHRPAVGPVVVVDHETMRSQLRNAPAVLVLILLNAMVFLFEISVGNWNDPEVLHRLGALEPYTVLVQHEYWRFFTALFLHGGLLHLGFNAFALYVLGPPLERSIGTMRFVLCYLISGLASGAGVMGLTLIGLVRPAQLVGASGCIMGIVGAWGGFLMRHRHAPHAKQRLANVVMIVVIQIAFDLSTPQVSMSAHLCGLVAGFFLGLVLAPRPKPAQISIT
jgi:membrane associated rhomboid family serine protease